jgi:hypothetical protein
MFLYFSYVKKSDNEVLKKEMELEEKKIALEMKKLEMNEDVQNKTENTQF